jgi:hypothetical protein
LEQINFDKLKDIYSSKNINCSNGKLGKIYSYRNDKLFQIQCKQYSCKKCRPMLKKDLHDKTAQAVDNNELNYHMIITFPGIEKRRKITYDQSYKIMNKDWDKLRYVIKYKYPDFKYILFPRAQTDPMPGNPIGYCHYHIIHNKTIDKKWLDDKTKKYTLGYTFLRYNEDVAGYLHNDFYIDDEWIIPFEIKHYRTTRDIMINPGQGNKMDQDNMYFSKNMNIQEIEKSINEKYSRILPFEEYMYQFTQVQPKLTKYMLSDYSNYNTSLKYF